MSEDKTERKGPLQDIKGRSNNSPTRMKMKDANLEDRRIIGRIRKASTRTNDEGSELIKNSLLKDIPESASKGKYISNGGKIGKQKTSIDISNLAMHMGEIGLNTDRDDFDYLDLYASHLIELVNSGVYSFVNLTKHERYILFRYFYKTNPILGRILDLHVDIALSKLQLKAPKGVPEIVRDFIMQFFEKVLDKVRLNNVLRESLLHYFLYGENYCLVEDYYLDFDTKLQDPDNDDLNEKVRDLQEDDKVFIMDMEDKYSKDPDSVGIEDRLKYLKLKFMNFFEQKYRGPDKIRTIKFYDILEYFHNEEIDFRAIRYNISDGFKALLDRGETDEELEDLGYSKGFIKLINANPEEKDKSSVIIDNDIYSGYPFIFCMNRYESMSLVQRVFDACVEWENSKRAFRAKINTIGKVGRIVTAEDASEPQIDALKSEVEQMMEDPNHAIVTNYAVTWEEVNSFLKDELNQLIDTTDRLKEELSIGLGMPDSLLSGDSQYSGDTIKLEVVNSQYFTLKNIIRENFEDRFIKPIALRKGLITVDSWGNTVLLYPKLAFARESLRSEEYFDRLFTMYQKGSLPVNVIYELLNLEPDDCERDLKNDLGTLKSDSMNELVRSIYDQCAEKIVSSTDLANKIIESLGLTKVKNNEENN